MIALEIGVGGGRVAKRTAPLCKELHAVDISQEMRKKAKANLGAFETVKSYHTTVSPSLPKELPAAFDFIYSFDVFVHCDIHTFYQTLLNIKPLLNKDHGLFFVSVANLCSKLGFERFKKQKAFKVAGFYCKFYLSHPHVVMSPDIVKTLVHEAGFIILKSNY